MSRPGGGAGAFTSPAGVGGVPLKRVLVLNQFALPRSEAGGTRHVDIFERLAAWEFRVVAGHLNHYSQVPVRTDDPRFVFVRIPRYTGAGVRRMAGWGLYAARAVVRSLALGRPHVVVASSPHLLTPLAGAVLATLWRRPLVVEVRDLWPETLVEGGAVRRGGRLHAALVTLERWIYRRADHVVVVTDGWEEHLAASGLAAECVTVVPNGTEVIDAQAGGREELRDRFGITGTTAVYAGAHGPTNALDRLLDAAAQVPGLDVILVGAGSEKVRLQERAARESMDNVQFRDPMPKGELMKLLIACDIGVHSVEPLSVLQLGMSPNKVFDYLAAGLPLVSNAGAGLARVLDDGECGLVGDADSLATSLQRMVDEGSAGRTTRGEAGRRLVARRFSRAAAAARMEEVLDGVL